MFHRYANNQSEEEFRSSVLKVRKTFNQKINGSKRFSFYYTNGYTHDELPVITQENPDDITWMHWGVVPNSLKRDAQKEEHLKMSCSLFERSEAVNSSWITKDSVETKRCLIPATGFFIWHQVKQWKFISNEERNEKFNYYVQMLNINYGDDPMSFCFPGVYNKWIDQETAQIFEG